jgi:hypothetical protein
MSERGSSIRKSDQIPFIVNPHNGGNAGGFLWEFYADTVVRNAVATDGGVLVI